MHNLITKLLRMSFVFVNFPSLMIQKILLGSTKNINFWRFTCSSLTSAEISKLFNSPHHFQIAPLVNSSQHFVKKLTLSGRISKVMWPWFYIDIEITIQYFVLIHFYLNRNSIKNVLTSILFCIKLLQVEISQTFLEDIWEYLGT